MEQLLRGATWTAAALLLAGLVLWIAGASQATLTMHAGLWLLISTPVARVLMALAEYLKTRDWIFVALTAIVVASLVFPLARYFLGSPT